MCKKRLLTMMVAIVMVLGMAMNYSNLPITVQAAGNLTQDENGAKIEFRGGSLRMDYEDYEKASMRFGYKIALPEGATLKNWSWKYTTSDPDKILYRKGEKSTVNEDGTINTNLVMTNIPKDYFETDITAKLKIMYTLSDGTVCTLEEDAFWSRSVKRVVENIMASSTATQEEKDYATNLFRASIDKDVYEDDFFD